MLQNQEIKRLTHKVASMPKAPNATAMTEMQTRLDAAHSDISDRKGILRDKNRTIKALQNQLKKQAPANPGLGVAIADVNAQLADKLAQLADAQLAQSHLEQENS